MNRAEARRQSLIEKQNEGLHRMEGKLMRGMGEEWEAEGEGGEVDGRART